ncbi:hypothetical protein BKA65DRAFT_416103, partial [Rhexocercosporidium sp. MPI-PUGE-AT-0058]
WCSSQKSTCGLLCSGGLQSNDCDTATLAFDCTCLSNGSSPGLQYYTNTMPTFICEHIFGDCVAASVGDASAQAACVAYEKENCGNSTPPLLLLLLLLPRRNLLLVLLPFEAAQ